MLTRIMVDHKQETWKRDVRKQREEEEAALSGSRLISVVSHAFTCNYFLFPSELSNTVIQFKYCMFDVDDDVLYIMWISLDYVFTESRFVSRQLKRLH